MKMMDGMKMLREAGLAQGAQVFRSIRRCTTPSTITLQPTSIPLLFHVADPLCFWDPDKAPQGARDQGAVLRRRVIPGEGSALCRDLEVS